jgi:prevent-host-death family protein
MESRISATELARRLGDVLGRVRYRGESFLVERNGEPVAKVVPLAENAPATLAEALAAWREDAEPDASFAEDLARAGQADRPPASPWAS